MTASYVYGLTGADTDLPDGLTGLGPSGRVSLITHGRVGAIVSDVPTDRPLGTREDLIAHETVVDTVAGGTVVLPLRFPAVIDEADVVDELLAPHHDRIGAALAGLDGHQQYNLRGRYDRDAVLGEVLRDHPEVRTLRERIGALPHDASYPLRLHLGEVVVAELERLRDADADALLGRLDPVLVDSVVHPPHSPEEVVNIACLVRRDDRSRFENVLEDQGREWHGRARLTLIGPLAPYDFVPEL